jgi:YesN/AraC family two-component response regulator
MEEIKEALSTMITNIEKARNIGISEDAKDDELSANSFIVRQALAYLEKNYAEKLTLQDLADHCFVSQWHLSKLLNKHTGKSFYDLLNATRIRAAKKLLSDPKLKIGDICELVGYADTGHFSRVFKKIEGISANEYRNQHEV